MSDQLFTYLQTQQETQQETQQAADLRGYLPHLSERDLALILLWPPEYAPAVLQHCFGSDAAEAKAAWNEYVLRYIDGARQPQG